MWQRKSQASNSIFGEWPAVNPSFNLSGVESPPQDFWDEVCVLADSKVREAVAILAGGRPIEGGISNQVLGDLARNKVIPSDLEPSGVRNRTNINIGRYSYETRKLVGVRKGGSECYSVFICNIPRRADERWNINMFKKFGRIVDAYAPGRASKVSNQFFGFVKFDCVDAANSVVSKMNGSWVEGRKIEVQRARFAKEEMANYLV